MGANKVENLGMGARREAPKSLKIPPPKAITAAGQPPDTDQMSTVCLPDADRFPPLPTPGFQDGFRGGNFSFVVNYLWVFSGLRLKSEAVPDQAFLDGGDGRSGPILGRRR